MVKIIEACEGQVVSSLEAGHIPVTTDKILGLIETDYSFASSDKSHLSDNFSHCKSKVAFVIHEGEITQAIFMGILPEKMTSSYPRLIVDFYKSFGKFYSCQPQVIAEKPLLPPKGKMLINGPLIDRLPTGTQLEGVLKSVKIFCKAAPSLAEGSRRIIPCYSSSHLLRKKNNNLHHEDVFSLEPSAILSTGNLIVSAERKGTASRIEKASSSASVVDKFATSGVANEIENGENNSGFQSSFFKKRRRL